MKHLGDTNNCVASQMHKLPTQIVKDEMGRHFTQNRVVKSTWKRYIKKLMKKMAQNNGDD